MKNEVGSGPEDSWNDSDWDQFYSGGDGSSPERAVIINLPHVSAETPRGVVGVKLEYLWIGRRFPGAQPIGQSLVGHSERVFDLITVRLPSGEEKAVYFDIGSFFGKARPAVPTPPPSAKRHFWFTLCAGYLGVIGLMAWATRATILTEVKPFWILFFGGLLSLIVWLKLLPAMVRSPLAGGRLHLVVGAAIVLLFLECLSIWHFFPGARVHLENFSDADVKLLLDGKPWATIRKNTSRATTLSRGSRGLTVQEASTGKSLDQHSIEAYDSGPCVLNVLGAQTYYQGSISYGSTEWGLPNKPAPEETAIKDRWFRARVNYLFERPPPSIEIESSEGDRARTVERTYLLRNSMLDNPLPGGLIPWKPPTR